MMPPLTHLEKKWASQPKPKATLVKLSPTCWEYRYEDGRRIRFNPTQQVAIHTAA